MLNSVRASRCVLFKIIVGLNTNSAIASVNVAIVKLCTFVNVAVRLMLDDCYLLIVYLSHRSELLEQFVGSMHALITLTTIATMI